MHKSQILSAHSHEFIISHYACSECIKELFIWHCAPSETTEPQIESSSSQIESTIVIQSRFKSNHHLELPMTTVTGGQGLTLHAKGQISRLYGSKVSKCLFLCLQHRCTLWRDYPLTIRKHCYTIRIPEICAKFWKLCSQILPILYKLWAFFVLTFAH